MHSSACSCNIIDPFQDGVVLLLSCTLKIMDVQDFLVVRDVPYDLVVLVGFIFLVFLDVHDVHIIVLVEVLVNLEVFGLGVI